MDKITIVLQDKQTIEQLAANPDVQLRIKDAIIDGIARRSLKFFNLDKDVLRRASEEIRKELFTGTYGVNLRNDYKDIIRKQVKNEFNRLVEEELVRYGNETKKEIQAWKADAMKRIQERDIEKDIREVAECVIRKKLER